jgi:hypothetical protein
VCASYIYCRVTVLCVWLGDFGLPLALFQVDLGCLFSPHHVNQGGVQKTTVTPEVTLYKSDTVKKSLSRDEELTDTARYCLVSAGQAWELLLVLIRSPR